jgi:lysozyme
MNVPENTIELVSYFEGFYSKPYRCPANVWTIGYGSTRYPNGQRVTPKDPAITKEQANEIMVWELQGCADSVLRVCPGLAAYNEPCYGAIVDFCYNLGVGKLQSSTLKRKINAGLWDEVPIQLNKWVYGGGRVLKGLVLRRQAEAAYFNLI